jgi:hypothetical protein
VPLYVILDSPVVGTGTIEEFRQFLITRKTANHKAVIPKEEKTMKLEMAILAGDESKKFLAALTTQIDRLEKLAPLLKGKTEPDAAAPEETDEDEDDDFAAKKGKEKKAKSFDEDEEKTEAVDDEETDDTDEDEDDDEDEKPVKKGKTAKAKKITADDVNDACKKHAKENGREATLKVLKKKFKVESVTELKPEQYEEVIKAVAVEEE